jgi:hypothetical protein
MLNGRRWLKRKRINATSTNNVALSQKVSGGKERYNGIKTQNMGPNSYFYTYLVYFNNM